MNEPKRNHFIAQMLSRRFTDENGKLYFFDKRFPEKGVQPVTPKNIFVVGNLYTQHYEDGDKDTSLEKMFADLEGTADTIIRKILGAARTRELPDLTPIEKSNWDRFFYYQWKRVPDMHNNVFGPEQFQKLIHTKLENFEATRPLTIDEHAKLHSQKTLDRLIQNAKVQAIARLGEEVLQMFQSKGLVTTIIQKPEKSFVIGSNPIVKPTSPSRSRTADSIWFPIAHDVVVAHDSFSGKEKLVEITEDSHIRAINKATFNQSTTIAGRSPALIASLAKAR
ncbi:MAG: hypothetical protein COA65_00705 [Rhodospirillaceae bacterium]|nr:MAG: hypothetical protein COA65_00705 [Rhodospirillaceae bacterium]